MSKIIYSYFIRCRGGKWHNLTSIHDLNSQHTRNKSEFTQFDNCCLWKATVSIILIQQLYWYTVSIIVIHWMPHSQLLLNIMLGVLYTSLKHGKWIKGKNIGRKSIKLPLFIENVMVYIDNPKESTKNY